MTWPQLQLLLGSAIIGACVQNIVFILQRKKIREESSPEKLTKLADKVDECTRRLDEVEDEKKQERKDDVGIRERLRYLEAKINGAGWRKEH
jgi:hypothetical protein